MSKQSSKDGFPMGEDWDNPYPTPPKNIKDAVHRHCKSCNGIVRKWEECTSPRCSLFPYRPGTSTVGRPTRKKRQISEKQIAVMQKGRNKARETR